MKLRSFLRAVLAGTMIATILVQAASADAPVGATVGVQVQNLAATEASIILQAVDQTGAPRASFPDKIPASSSKTYFPLDTIGITSAFNGSLVVSSNATVAAIANVAATSSTGTAITAAYGGISNASPSATLPLIMKNNGVNVNDTIVNVQNAGTSDVNVTIDYTPSTFNGSPIGNAGCKQTATIKPNSAKTFDQGRDPDTDFTGCTGGLGAKFVGSAKVTATGGNIATAVLQVGKNAMLAYTGFSQGSTNPILPLVNANNNGNTTGIQIANLGSAETNVTVTYKASAGFGTDCTETQKVPAGGSTTFALVAFANSSMGAAETCADAPTRFVGAGIVSANSASQPLVAIVNQQNNTKGTGGAYGAFAPETATDKVSLPLIMDNNGNFKLATGFSIVNVGTAAVDIKCDYSTVNGHTPASDTGTGIQPGAALVVLNNTKLRKDNNTAYVGSASCVATGTGAKIVGVVNQTATLTTGLNGKPAGDKLAVYEGFAKQ